METKNSNLPPVNLHAPFNILRASHIKLWVSKLAESRKFYENILGFHLEEADAKTLYFRGMEERNISLILEQKEASSCQTIGYRVASEEDLDKAFAWFTEKGLVKSFKTESSAFSRGRVLKVASPLGLPMEFCYSIEKKTRLTQKYGLYKGVHPLRIDHFNVFSSHVQNSLEFHNDMGFRLTEYTETDENPSIWAAWMHRKGGVHDIAFTNGLGPRLHHFAYWIPTPLNIIHLCDVMATSGYLKNLERGPGRHGISNAFFLYILDPDMHRIEFYCSDYLTVDTDTEPIRWSLKDARRQTLWGSPAPRSWFEHGSSFTGVSVLPPKLKAIPLIAN